MKQHINKKNIKYYITGFKFNNKEKFVTEEIIEIQFFLQKKPQCFI
jgi:hypothetical protein